MIETPLGKWLALRVTLSDIIEIKLMTATVASAEVHPATVFPGLLAYFNANRGFFADMTPQKATNPPPKRKTH